MNERRRGCRSRLIAIAVGLTPILVLEVALHLSGYSSDVVAFFGPERPVFVQNGEVMELAPEHRRQFRTEPFPAEKAPGTTRIIVVGDSTAYGFTWITNRGEDGRPISLPDPYPVLLERALTRKYPGRSFEVINCGGVECATYRLQRVVREVVGYSPDLVIFMAGSSDFLEARLIRNWRELHPFWSGLVRHWKTLALARNLLRQARGRPVPAESAEQVEAVEGDPPHAQLPPRGRAVAFHGTGLFVLAEDIVKDRAEAKAMLADSVRNLETIAGICREHSVPLILCTVPSNLRLRPTTDLSEDPVLARQFLGDVSEQAAARFLLMTDRIRGELEGGRWHEALTLLEQARGEFSEDPRVAMLHFLEARAHEGLRDWKSARRAYIRAKDLDPFIWRVPDGVNEAVRRISREDGVRLADIERAFMRAVPDGIPDNRLFYDYCHFRPAGHAVATEELMAVLE
jgi:hypothetical protein